MASSDDANSGGSLDFLTAGGEMGARIRAHDWASTPLGAPDGWPQSLRSPLSICLHSSFPTAIYWGPQLRLLYNDAWSPIPAERHPWALGRPAEEVWSDIWEIVGPQFQRVLETGEGYSTYDQMLPMVRDGRVRETFWNYSITALRGEDGSVAGIFNQGHETTERVLAERRGVEERERLRQMFDQAPGFMAMLRGPEHVFELTNSAYLQLVGHRQVVGKPVRQALPELEGQGFFELLDRVYESGEAFVGTSMPVDLQQEPGAPTERRFVDFVFQPTTDAEGQVTGIFAEGADVTERTRAETALRELTETLERRVSEALAERKVFADIVEGTKAFVQVADTDYRLLAINKASADEFERLFRVRPKAGDSLQDLLADHPQRQSVLHAWGRALAGEEFTEISVLDGPADERRFYEISYNVLRGAGGEQIGAYQFVQDVTDRMREQERLTAAERARSEADAQYRAYFENTAEALFVVKVLEDGGFTVEDLNPAHQAGIGLPLEQVYGKRIDEILPPETAERVQSHYKRVLETGEVYQYRDTFLLPTGTSHWDTVLVPVRDADGRIVRIIGSSRDLTRQLAAEEQLRQAQKMDAMGQLTGGVAHDFNNLLTPILGSLDMLQRRQIGGERERRLIDGAFQSAERAKVLVQRLLAFARRQPLQSSLVDIGELVRGMADLVDSTTGPQINVVVNIADDLPWALADANQLEMAILNLSVNARDAMPQGGTLRISAEREPIGLDHASDLSPGDYVRVSVADTGTGMDPETLKKSVEPFFSTKGIGKGTGLGLSMAHGLAAQLGGGLRIASQLGLGTNVELWLPAGQATEALQESTSGDAALIEASGTALLVDDEDLVRASTADMLADLGYMVVEVTSAEEALKRLDDGLHPDLIVTDHLMPGMSGSDLAREARGRWPSLPVLLVSGYAEAEGVAPDLARLVKPFRQAELADSIAKLIAEPDGG